MAASCAVTFAAQRSQAVVALETLPPGFRLATAALGTGEYLQKTFWPAGLSVFYPYWHGVSLWRPVGWAAAIVALTAATLWQWRRRPYLGVGWLWFLGMLVPVSGLVQVGSQAVADRYTYLPHIGLFIALCWAGQEAWQRWPRARSSLAGAAGVAMAACVALSAWQAHFWRDGVSLFGHSIAALGRPSSRLLELYAGALTDAGRPDEAEAAYEAAWRSNPAANNHEAAEFLGIAWLRQGRAQDVIGLLEPLARRPDAAPDTLNLLARASVAQGKTGDALTLYRRSVERDPGNAATHFALADLLRSQGDVPAACAEYEAGLERRADCLPALTYLAWTYAHLDSPDAHERARFLARRAAALGRGQDLGGLEALAAAEASTGHWPQAVQAEHAALTLTEDKHAPSTVIDACRERLASYQQGSLP